MCFVIIIAGIFVLFFWKFIKSQNFLKISIYLNRKKNSVLCFCHRKLPHHFFQLKLIWSGCRNGWRWEFEFFWNPIPLYNEQTNIHYIRKFDCLTINCWVCYFKMPIGLWQLAFIKKEIIEKTKIMKMFSEQFYYFN